jgi:Cof subfamily protein (haloacid dehalogenase superfamily)
VPNIKLIATDLDRTLLRTDKSISDYTAKVLQRCRARGIKIVFATARSYANVADYETAVRPDALILTNGAVTRVGGTVTASQAIPPHIVAQLLAALRSHPGTRAISARGLHSSYTNNPQKAAQANQSIDICHLTDFAAPPTEPILHLSARHDDHAFMAGLAAQYPQVVMWLVSDEDLYDINLSTATKWNALSAVVAQLGITPDEVITFGDDLNDIEMLQSAGIGVAVANALPEAKAVADFVCGSNDNDGVARWIEENVL